jgi:hypothetical protein
MKTYILVGNVSDIDRKEMERLENTIYPSLNSMISELKDLEVTAYELSDFMDAVNDQEIDILSDSWISYIHHQ